MVVCQSNTRRMIWPPYLGKPPYSWTAYLRGYSPILRGRNGNSLTNKKAVTAPKREIWSGTSYKSSVLQHTVVYTVSTPVYEYTYIVTNQAKECPTAHMRYMGSWISSMSSHILGNGKVKRMPGCWCYKAYPGLDNRSTIYPGSSVDSTITLILSSIRSSCCCL